MESEGFVAVTCVSCGMFVFLPRDMNDYTCNKCKLVVLLEEKVQQLEERVSALRLIKDHERFTDRVEQTVLGGEQRRDVLREVQSSEDSGPELNRGVLEQEFTSRVQELGGWKNVTKRSKKNREQLVSLKIQNRYEILSPSANVVEQVKEKQVQSSVYPRVTSDSEILANPQKRRVVVVGDSLL